MRIFLTNSLLALIATGAVFACNNAVPGYGPAGDRGADAGIPQDEEETGEQDPGEPDPGDDVPEPLELRVSVTPTQLALEPGDTAQAMAVVTSDGTAVDSPVSWFSSNELVAIVDNSGLIRAIGDGQVEISAEVGGQANASSASLLVTVSSTATCPAGTGNNGDSCANIYQGQDIWRCAISPNLGNATVSQVCRDQGAGAKWITFHVNPTECCSCAGDFSVACCAANSGSSGCP